MLELFSDPARARSHEEEAYRLAEELGDQATAAIARAGAAYALILQEQVLEAIPELEQSLALAEQVGDPRGVAWISSMLSIALLSDHARRDEGRRNVERALSMSLAAGEDGDKAMPSFAHFILGLYWRWTGQSATALEHFQAALELMRELELVPNLSSVLLQIARLLATSEPARAARLAGAAITFAERAGIRFPPRYGRAADQLYESLRGRLGATRAQNAWTQGSQLSTVEALELAVSGSGRMDD